MAHLVMLEAGKYPPEPTSYEGHNTGRNQVAPFETVCLIRAELTSRLDRCPRREVKLLQYEAEDGRPLSSWSWDVLNYASGARKTMPFNDWKYQKQKRKRRFAK